MGTQILNILPRIKNAPSLFYKRLPSWYSSKDICSLNKTKKVINRLDFSKVFSSLPVNAMNYSSSPVQINITPKSCLPDEAVHVKVSGLSPNQTVTISATLREINRDLCSYAYYKADSSGCLDLNTDQSTGGSFTGVLPMGLFGTLKPAPHEKQFVRYLKKDIENVSSIIFKVYDGNIGKENLYNSEIKELSIATHERHFIAPGVKRTLIKHGNLRGSLFTPSGKGPFPGVIDMLGSAGGLLEYRAAMLANHGIASLALAYCAYDDLPRHLEEFHMSYFKEGVKFLLEADNVCKPSVGVLGFSKSGDLALSMGAFIKEVSAIVNVNGSYGNIGSPLVVDDNKTIPPLFGDPSKVKILGENLYDISEVVNDPLDFPETIIPLEQSDAQILFVVSGDDKNYNSFKLANDASERLKSAGKGGNFKILKYEDAGHCLDPPHLPYCEASYHPLVRGNCIWGGNLKAHMEAQEQSWPLILEFFKKNIPCQPSKL